MEQPSEWVEKMRLWIEQKNKVDDIKIKESEKKVRKK